MKLTATKLYELREIYQDSRDGYIFYSNRVAYGDRGEYSKLLSYYDGQISGMERVLRALDLSWDDFISIVGSNE